MEFSPNFTPIQSLLGGALIGLAATLFMFSQGRILGASGFLRDLIADRNARNSKWRNALLLGMLTAPFWLIIIGIPRPEIILTAPALLLILSGLLVGIGTHFASGCTSGHGICGLSRLSPRSGVAVICFMSTGMLTIFVIRHFLGA